MNSGKTSCRRFLRGGLKDFVRTIRDRASIYGQVFAPLWQFQSSKSEEKFQRRFRRRL